MTPKQMYSELSKIAGHRCGDEKPFLVSNRVTKTHIEVIKNRMAALLEKLSYERTRHDFPPLYRPLQDRHSPRVRRRTARLIERELREEAVRDATGDGYAMPSPSSLRRAVEETTAAEMRRMFQRASSSLWHADPTTPGTLEQALEQAATPTVSRIEWDETVQENETP